MEIGSTFSDELAAAGLVGLPIWWDAETGRVGGRERLSAEQAAALDAVIAAHDSRRVPAAQVKVEAGRRILARIPDWKQRNMAARGVELQDIWRRLGQWTEGEQSEADALQAAWDWVKSVRAASDVLEALSPIPADFQDDRHWPA